MSQKKSQGITMTTIVIAVLAILVLVTLAILFSGKMFKFGQKTESIEGAAGNVDYATCQLKCTEFNNVCVVEDKQQNKYKISNNEYCRELENFITTNCRNFGFSVEGRAQPTDNLQQIGCKISSGGS